MEMAIRFGTAGWRGVIGEDFTFANVRRLSVVLAHWLQARYESPRVVIGYDTRFLSERFAEQSARVFARNRIPVWLCQRDAPHPAISWAVVRRGASLGLNFTGSHNLPQYSGIKVIDERGGLMGDEVTHQWEADVEAYSNHSVIALTYDEQWVTPIDPRPDYLEQLARMVPPERLQRRLRVVVDPLYGSTREYLESYLTEQTPIEVEPLHSFKDPYFGGYGPEATRENLQELIRFVRDGSFDLGLAMDGDGDRFGIVDRDGVYVQPEQVLCILYDYLLEGRGERGGVVRNIATTHLLDRIAQAHGQPVIQTPIGYKNAAPYLWRDDILVAVEESAGFTLRPHIPDKDGMLACLVATEVVAQTGEPLMAYWQKIVQKYGPLYQAKGQCTCDESSFRQYQQWLRSPPTALGPYSVHRVETLDGIKLYIDDETWLLVRMAGTEPLIRVYAESPHRDTARRLVQTAIRFMQGEGR
jgi:phosphoglucomutase